MSGFQLWVNPPAKKKMIAPKYRGIAKDQIPISKEDGIETEAIAGVIDGVEGPVGDLAVDVEYFDVTLAAGMAFKHVTRKGFAVFVYGINGSGYSGDALIESGRCALFGEGDSAQIGTKDGFRFLFVSGKPLREPVAWGGPIVMNSEEELAKAFQELEEGTFIKAGKTVKPSRSYYRT